MDKKALTAVLALRRWSKSRSVDGQKREKAKQTHQSARARTEGEHPSSPLLSSQRYPYLPPQQTIIRLFRTWCGLFPTKAFQAQDMNRLQQMRNQYDVNKEEGSESEHLSLPDTEGSGCQTRKPCLKLPDHQTAETAERGRKRKAQQLTAFERARTLKCRSCQVRFKVCFVEICIREHQVVGGKCRQFNWLSLNLLNNSRGKRERATVCRACEK